MPLKHILKAIFLSLRASARVLLLLIASVLVYEEFNEDQRVAGLLNIGKLPASLKIIKCKTASPLTTDTIITCSIEIEPGEFPRLLEGYNFKKRETNRTDYPLSDYKLEGFKVTESYHMEPEWMKSGGSVDVYTNHHYKRALVHYYRE